MLYAGLACLYTNVGTAIGWGGQVHAPRAINHETIGMRVLLC